MTQKRLKELFEYNPQTGMFIRIMVTSNRIKKGDVAGTASGNGYLKFHADNVLYFAHRMAWLYMTGEEPKKEIDHKNHDRSDNRWCNLREVGRIDQCRNMSRSKINRSGVTGVYWNKKNKRWIAQINGEKKLYLGSFKTLAEAKAARKVAESLYGYHENHGESL